MVYQISTAWKVNACRYAGPDGVVRIGVQAHGRRISLTVEDSGPGIVEAERPQLFNRFHRATEQGSGAGLGLAIGDSIVRSTGGRWHIGDSLLGEDYPRGPAAVASTAGIIASSIALIAFGLDSVVELAAGAIVIWQLRGGSSQREHRAVHLIGATFFLLAAYLVIESIRDLVSQVRPEASTAGLIVTAAALLVMPLLALAKHRTGQAR